MAIRQPLKHDAGASKYTAAACGKPHGATRRGVRSEAAAAACAEPESRHATVAAAGAAKSVRGASLAVPATPNVETAQWGSSIPRMPQALREAFMAEVKSLQKKPIMKITTSVEGAYGESSVFSLLKLFYLLNSKFGLTEHSTFLDIGSGSGVPSFTAAAFGCPYSLGFELDSTVYSISIINQLSLVDLLLLQQLCLSTHVNQEGLEANIEEALLRFLNIPSQSSSTAAAEQTVETSIQNHSVEAAFPRIGGVRESAAATAGRRRVMNLEKNALQSERRLIDTTLGFNGAFSVFDCSRLLSLEGISHVFSFDLAMPPWIIGHIVQLFNQSRTTFVYVSFHGDLVSHFGMQAVLATRLCMRMGTSAESHVGFIYQKVPKEAAQRRQQLQTDLQRVKQQLLQAAIRRSAADAAAAASDECLGRSHRRLVQQQKQLRREMLALEEDMQGLQKGRQPQLEAYRNRQLGKQQKGILRLLEALKQQTLDAFQQLMRQKQEALMLRQQQRFVALLLQQQQQEEEQNSPPVSQEQRMDTATRLLLQQHQREQQDLAQQLSLQYEEEVQRQQTLLEEAEEAAAALAATALSPRAATGSRGACAQRELQRLRQQLREKQQQLQEVDQLLQKEDEQKRQEQQRQRIEALQQQRSELEREFAENGEWMLAEAQRHTVRGQEQQRLQLMLIRGIANSITDRYLHSLGATNRLQQVTRIAVAAVSMLPSRISPSIAAADDEEVRERQQQQRIRLSPPSPPCCCSSCCLPPEGGSNSQRAEVAATWLELMSAAHPQQQLLLLRRVFSAFQVDQLLERESLQHQEDLPYAGNRGAEALLVHLRDAHVEDADAFAKGPAQSDAAVLPSPPPKSSNTSSTSNTSSNCIVCLGGAAAALAALFLSIPRAHIIELDFCEQAQQQLQCKRASRPIRRQAAATVAANAAASSTAAAAGGAEKRSDCKGRAGRRGKFSACSGSGGSVRVVMPCLSPLCASCCYEDSLLLQLLRCSMPLAAQQQLLQQEISLQHRMPLMTVIDQQQQQRLEQQRMQEWKAKGLAGLLAASAASSPRSAFRRSATLCRLTDACQALELLEQNFLQPHELPDDGEHDEGAASGAGDVEDDNSSAGDSSRSSREALKSPASSCAKRERAAPQQLSPPPPKRGRLSAACSSEVCAPEEHAAAQVDVATTAASSRSAARAKDAAADVWASEVAAAGAALRVLPHEEQLLAACASATAHPTLGACKRAVKLLLQQQHALSAQQEDGGVGEPQTSSDRCRKGSPQEQMQSLHGGVSPSDPDCCSVHSSRSTCASTSSRGLSEAARRSALVRTARHRLQLLQRQLSDMRAGWKRHFLLQLLQRQFPHHKAAAAAAAAADPGVQPILCSCSPAMLLEHQEVLLRAEKGSCAWWRLYYTTLSELAVLKEAGLYRTIDSCVQEQQQRQQEYRQQEQGEPKVSPKEAFVWSNTRPPVLEAEGPVCSTKRHSVGCPLPELLLQSPMAPYKRRSHGGA
ncbi:uncharacterized protein LOC34620543 [Cyclospora cayetanensis]|uniref:Uncharacterized protein LOC34620543 n=1 Tax=Cyclospora cayetanensis TaxID=88456 RepID=A0A6P6S0V8_9EIME|nr:uncharacterized protein LOC34620543 [Cyclospora cayetanensis]